MTYCNRIDGKRVVRGVCRRLEDGRFVRMHAVRKWGELYWSGDLWGEIWEQGKTEALAKTPADRLDVVTL